MAHEEGFEYRSERFDHDIELSDTGYDNYTDEVALENAVKLATRVPAPSGFSTFVGFAP